jgi:hypothetical protein
MTIVIGTLGVLILEYLVMITMNVQMIRVTQNRDVLIHLWTVMMMTSVPLILVTLLLDVRTLPSAATWTCAHVMYVTLWQDVTMIISPVMITMLALLMIVIQMRAVNMNPLIVMTITPVPMRSVMKLMAASIPL